MRPRSCPPATSLPRRRHAAVAGALAGTLLVLGAAGCGGDTTTAPTTSSPASTGPTTSVTPTDAAHGHIGGTDNTGVPGPGGATCISKAPGELYTAAEAVIRFSPESICPGFVTVAPGTPVTFANLGTEAYTVTLSRGTQADAPVLATETVAPGATWVQTFDATGDVTFRISAIRGFLGTIHIPQTAR